MMTMRNPTRSGLASARARARGVDFVARDVDAVWTREGLERRARERTGTNRKRRAVLRARRFASRARVAKRNPSTVSSPLIPRARRDGLPLQTLGWYDPIRKQSNLDAPAIKDWIAKGAQPSETVGALLKKALIIS